VVSEAGGLGQPVAGGGGKGEFDSVFESAFVAYGNKKGFDIGSGSQDGADGLLVVFEEGISAFLQWGWTEGADEPAFCTADGGFVETQSEVGGQAESAGMGNALAVDEEQVGGGFEFSYGGDAGGCFTKREQAGYVREGKLSAGGGGFEVIQLWQSYYDGGGENVAAVFCESAVEPGNEFWCERDWGNTDP